MFDMHVFNGGPCLICMCLMEVHVDMHVFNGGPCSYACV
jgi:hypothetical protein